MRRFGLCRRRAAQERVKPILDMASAASTPSRAWRASWKSRAQLENRKVIDRAKGILMKAKSIGEEEAYTMLRRDRDEREKKMAEMARSVVTAAELFE